MYLSRTTNFVAFCVLWGTIAHAEDLSLSRLPEPFTLEAALNLIDQQHPDLRFADAGLQNARADLQRALSNYDFDVSLSAEGRWIEPSAQSADQRNEDHRAGLFITKTLYDFGRSAAQTDMAGQNIESQNYQYLNAQQQQYLEVMKRYFAVVLADLNFYRYNEEMAVAYIQYDKMQKRKMLGQATEIAVVEKEVEYQKIRGLRTSSESQQRVTRALLAQALNRPDNLPDTVARPKLDVLSRKLPEIEDLQKAATENNLLLGALRAQLAAAKNNIDVARSGDNPTLTGAVEAFSYARETASTDKWRAKVTLNVPLWSGDRTDAAVAKAKSAVYKLEAALSSEEINIKQQVLELWMKLETLRIKHEEMRAAMNFAELSLDKNRALYELEVQADLGYSMVLFSEAERNLVKTDFEIALAWAHMDALNGTLLNKNSEQNLIK